ncbi:MAG: hypothetical protein CVU41_05525 [Chloroflexi bacterium HGW-Chloroflexi-3]|nr:MAG: hypothetical protein CVU41_05525 [Chloroflexi bacterium HGW-Chloroflexi-3]
MAKQNRKKQKNQPEVFHPLFPRIIDGKAINIIDSIEKIQFSIKEKREYFSRDHENWIKEKDIRYSIFSRFNKFLFATKLSIIFIETDLKNPYWWQNHFSQLQLGEKTSSLQIYEQWVKHHLGMSLFIQTEYFFRTMLRFLDPNVCNNSTSEFINIYECLLSKINLNFPEPNNLLNLLRLIRNTIHNDGLYRNKNFNNESVIYKDKEYNFFQDTLIDFVTWDFLLLLTNDIIELIFEIIINEKIISLPTAISDQ